MMKKRDRRSFSQEYKREAASLVLDQDYSVAEACRAMDVCRTSLNRWVQQFQGERNGSPTKGKPLTPEQQRIRELEAQVKRLEEEKSILKKATALLMSDEIVSSR